MRFWIRQDDDGWCHIMVCIVDHSEKCLASYPNMHKAHTELMEALSDIRVPKLKMELDGSVEMYAEIVEDED